MTFKFLHAADLHIDSPLAGLAKYDGAPEDELRGATRKAMANLVSAAVEHAVDLVVLAGDIFDGDWRDFQTGLFFVSQLSKLADAGIPVVLVAGNHDAASVISRNLTLPPSVTRLADNAAEICRFDDLEVAVIGQSYANKSVENDLVVDYPTADPGLFTIGLLHTSLDGRPGHANYAPTSLDRLRSKNYDYWALGHVHQREEVHQGDPWVVFPGNLQGRHARETGPKGATLVTVEDREIVSVVPLILDEVRWERVSIDATDLDSVDDILSVFASSLSAVVADNGHRLSAVRVEVTGRSPAHQQLWRDPHGFEAQVRAVGLQHGLVWVEKVKALTTRSVDLGTLYEDDAVGALVRRIAEISADEAVLDHFASLFDDLRKKLGADVHTDATARIGTSEHVAEMLGSSLEAIIAGLPGEPA